MADRGRWRENLLDSCAMDRQQVSQIFAQESVSLLFIAAFSVYLLTLAPTISLADSPELVAAAFTLGVAHPPGYGLYLLVGKLFSFLPLGTVAWRLNLMAAVCASLTGVTSYLSLRRLGEIAGGKESPAGEVPSALIAFAVALILAFSPTFWGSAVGTEVYSFHAFLFSLLLRSVLGWNDSPRFLPLSLFLAGLLVASHTSNLIFLAVLLPLGIGYFIQSGRGRSSLVFSLVFFLLGLSAVVYLPVRSAASPSINLGEIAGLGDFYRILAGKVYLGELPDFAVPWGERWFNVKHGLFSPGDEFGWSLSLLGLLGAGILGRRAPLPLFFLLLASILNLAFFGSSDLGASARGRFPFPSHLFLPFYISSALLVGVGLMEAMRGLARRSFLKPGLGRVLFFLLFLFLFSSSSLSSFPSRYRTNDHRGSYGYYERGRKSLKALEKGSVLLCSNAGNVLFFFWYFNTVEGKWSDVKHLTINPFLANPLERLLRDPRNREASEHLKDRKFRNRRELRLAIIDGLIQTNIDRASLYTNLPEEYLRKDYVMIPRGEIYKVQRGMDLKEVLVEGPPIEETVGVRYGGAVELVGLNLDRKALEAGDHFRITYFWRALQELKKDYQVAVLITDKEGEVVKKPFGKSLSHSPVYGAFPTSRWPREKVVREAYDLVNSLGRLEAGEYWISIGVGDDQELLPVTESTVPVEGRFARVGRFEVLP